MSNAYAFDFLKSEHTLSSAGQPKAAEAPTTATSTTTVTTSTTSPEEEEDRLDRLVQAVAHKPDLEKQFDVIHFLQAHRSAGCLPPDVIYRQTGIDLEQDNGNGSNGDTPNNVAQMLQRNPKIRIDMVPDPENPSLSLATYAYQAKYNTVRNLPSLLAQINRCKNGVPMRDLLDAYEGVDLDLQTLITAGDVLALQNTEDKDKILFPRGEAFLVELDGIVSLTKDGCLMETDVDPRKQIRRGEALQVGGQWFRVSSAVKEGASLSEQPVRAQAPLSVVSLLELSRKNEQDGYIRPLNHKIIPLDAPLTKESLQNLQQSKAAREKLHHLALNNQGARSGTGTAAQLLSSNAHASNPTVLAQSFASSAGAAAATTNARKRPNKNIMAASNMEGGAHANTSRGISAAKRRNALQAQQEAASDPALSLYSHARRHGCTKDVRDMYLRALVEEHPIPESDAELQQLLVKHQLLEPGEALRRPRLKNTQNSNVDNDGKPKKRRYYERKNQRMTNTHLEGTEIGAVLRRAQEVQRQGKSVGDGGM